MCIIGGYMTHLHIYYINFHLILNCFIYYSATNIKLFYSLHPLFFKHAYYIESMIKVTMWNVKKKKKKEFTLLASQA